MRCGFIGYGNMGGAIVRSLIGDGSLDERDVVVYNRTPERLDALKFEHPEIVIASSMAEVAREVELLFICVHTPAVAEVMSSIRGALTPGLHLVTINGGVDIAHMESVHAGSVSKVIPSITIEAGRGVALIAHGSRVSARSAEKLEELFSRSSMVKVLPEISLASATDITSCGPGLMASMIAQFALSGARAGALDVDEAMAMAAETMMATAMMLADGEVTPGDLAERVATKGGITEQGLKVLKSELPGTFDRMFEATRRKRAESAASMAGGEQQS